jgi:hypothetical protein
MVAVKVLCVLRNIRPATFCIRDDRKWPATIKEGRRLEEGLNRYLNGKVSAEKVDNMLATPDL